MSQPLWSEDNYTMFSDVFNVAQGEVCVLFAAGLLDTRVKTESTEFSGPQAVCVRRILFAPDIVFSKNATCDWVASATSASEIADELVASNGCCWELTPTNNLAIIGVPGIYRLEVNDATAVQAMQVYAEKYNALALPAQIQKLFF